MPRANFCVECGERLARNGWSVRLGDRFCGHCARRLGTFVRFRSLAIFVAMVAAAFAVGRYMRPAPPPLVIQRQANSPLPDTPVELGPVSHAPDSNRDHKSSVASVANNEGYICGARTQKGTPCRRRVHAAGDRCFQHKGLAAMVPMDKLVIKADNPVK